MTLEIVGRGFEKVRAELEAYQAKVERQKDRTARGVARIIAKAERVEAPRSKGVGRKKHLRGSIRVRKTVEGYTVGPRSPLAHLVIKGAARGQTEVASTARALSWAGAGARVFAHSSTPGPMPANPFTQRALEAVRSEVGPIAAGLLFHNAPEPIDDEGDG